MTKGIAMRRMKSERMKSEKCFFLGGEGIPEGAPSGTAASSGDGASFGEGVGRPTPRPPVREGASLRSRDGAGLMSAQKSAKEG